MSDFTPDDPDVQFYLGQGDGGATVGVVLFQQINTPHGPIEVGLSSAPTAPSPAAAVTTATVETKPWVQEATATGLMKRFVGMRQGDDARKALGGGGDPRRHAAIHGRADRDGGGAGTGVARDAV